METKSWTLQPAFPRPASEFTKSGTLPEGNDAIPAQDGMTLRDYFAAKAMVMIFGRSDTARIKADSDDFPMILAGAAYMYADAMLKARNPR